MPRAISSLAFAFSFALAIASPASPLSCKNCTQLSLKDGSFKVAQSGNCCTSCGGNTACTNCKSGEICDRACRGGNNPGVSCHPAGR